jgi:hypothetical protein
MGRRCHLALRHGVPMIVRVAVRGFVHSRLTLLVTALAASPCRRLMRLRRRRWRSSRRTTRVSGSCSRARRLRPPTASHGVARSNTVLGVDGPARRTPCRRGRSADVARTWRRADRRLDGSRNMRWSEWPRGAPEVLADLEGRALPRAEAAGVKPGTPEFAKWWRSYGPDPRGNPPSRLGGDCKSWLDRRSRDHERKRRCAFHRRGARS